MVEVVRGQSGFLEKAVEKAGRSLVVTGVALGALAYLARTFALPQLLQKQGYFANSAEGAVIKLLTKFSLQRMDSFEEDLPRLKPPPLEQSCEHLKKEGEVLLEGEVLEAFLKAVDDFSAGDGAGLQEALVSQSRGKGNYIQKIWEEEAYLKGRYLFGSNWFGLSTSLPPLTEGGDPQVIRATYMIEGATQFLDQIRKKSLKPFFLGIPIPVSMKQFDTLFGSCRIPQVGCDRLQKSSAKEDYFIVMQRGNYYRVEMRQSREDLYADLKAIRDDLSPAGPQIGFLTAAHRDIWAEKREALLSHEKNKKSLLAIEGAQFILCFEEELADGLTGMSKSALLKMSNRHFDMGMQWIVDRQGRCATNNEHTGAESTAQAQMLSSILTWEKRQLQDGKLHAPHGGKTAVPSLLSFDVDASVQEAIERAKAEAEAAAASYQVETFETSFGKVRLKEVGVSPDAFMQMSNLLAFYRLTGELSAVYETAMMRFFKDGRTETIGTLTAEAKALVLAMQKEAATPLMLRRALKVHKEATLTAMQNKGHERHMLALKVLAREKGIFPALFEDEGYKRLQRKRISSSQTPTDTGGGGFLPTEEDGIGISYIPRDAYFLVTVTAKQLSIPQFKELHGRAMEELFELLAKKG